MSGTVGIWSKGEVLLCGDEKFGFMVVVKMESRTERWWGNRVGWRAG